MNKKIKFQPFVFIKSLVISIFIALGLVIIAYKKINITSISNAMFVTGILILCFGLFRLTRTMQFYDLPIYGFVKLKEVFNLNKLDNNCSIYNSFSEYRHKNKYTASYIEIIFVSVIYILLAVVFIYL